MRKHYLMLLILLIAANTSLNAQTKHGVYGLAEGGVSIGEDRQDFIARAAVGYHFAYKWHMGIGAGYNAAFVRFLPAYATFRYDLSKKKNTFFVLADVGAAIPWFTDTQWPEWHGKATNVHPGSYSQAGVGFKTRLSAKTAFVLTATYANSNFNIRYRTPFNYIPEEGPTDFIEDYRYKFNQLCFTAGFQF
jgi:hypothetical protein